MSDDGSFEQHNERAPKPEASEEVVSVENVFIETATRTPPPSPPRESYVIALSQHNFKRQTFLVPTHCDVCEASLSGLIWKQGLKCESCGLTVHPKGDGKYDCCDKAMLSQCKSECQKNEESARERSKKESAIPIEANKEASSRQKHPADASILPRISCFLPKDYAEQAHRFETVRLKEPTYCDVCDGVLAGDRKSVV